MERKRQKDSWLLFLLAVVMAASACNLFSLIDQVDDAASTAKVVATDAKAIVTQVQGIATQVEESGIRETAQIVATQIAEQSSGVKATVKALATQASVIYGEAPTDIPMVETGRITILSSEEVVSYSTTLDFQDVLEFYKIEMPANGWVEGAGSLATQSSAILKYEKPNRNAVVNLSVNPGDSGTLVIINIQSK